MQFDLVVTGDSGDWRGWLGLGLAQVGLREFPDAADNLERAFRQVPPGTLKSLQWPGYFNLGVAYAQQGKKAQALKALKEAARMMPADQLVAFEAEPDLKPLRGERDFQALLASLKKVKKGK
jgi:tetratricopeptide (TPR) repeat protein